MTSRSKNAVRGYETEIEKSREESNWKKAIELAQQLMARSPQHESLAHFLIGEGKLEAYLDEWPPSKENFERAQRELSDARGYLTLATDEAGKKAGVALDAHLLLGKLNYACGAYDDALKNYSLAELATLTEKELPVRSLRIVAESYAIKGLCLEQNALPGSTSRYKQAERETEMIRSFELSSELTLLYLQRAAGWVRAGPTLETALQRAPILHIRAGRLHHAVHRYREMLSAVESPSTQALRLTLARQLAEVLMRGVTGQVYQAPKPPPVPAQSTLTRRREDYISEGPWKPKKYASINQFVPCNELEEVVLVLVVGEAMAVRDAVLSQSAEFEAARRHSLRAAAALADLLALAAARWRRLQLLLESLERAMKFSFGLTHVWRQRALATAAVAEHAPRPPPHTHLSPGSNTWDAYVKAHAVMRRAAPMAPDDAPLRLVAANTYYSMGWIEEGIEMADQAVAIEEEKEGFMLARCYLYKGIGHQMKAQKTNCRVEKEAENDMSLKYLLRSVEHDDHDHLAFYYLGLQYMYVGMFNEAMDASRTCLSLRPSCGGALRVACALWARAAPRHPRAPLAARLAARPHPAALAALTTGKELLSLLTSAEEEEEIDDLDALSDSPHDTLSARDATSIHAESAGAHRAERVLSGEVSERQQHQAGVWLHLADLCLRLDRVSSAAGCVSEAAALTPYSHLVLYTRGRVHAASKEWEEARQCFQNALAIHPTHLDSIVQLGGAYYELGWLRLSEKCLREAVSLCPGAAESWRRLALVLRDPAAAADAAAAALALHHQH